MGAGRDLHGRHKDGTEFPIEIGLSPMTTGSGEAVLASVADISERKKTDDALKRYSAELEQKNKDLDEFAYVASHDLKSPLRAIGNLSQWVLEDAGEVVPEESKEHLEQLKQRVRKMDKLLPDDLLEYSRIGRAEETIELIDPAVLVEEIKDLIEIPEAINIEVASKLPSVRAPRTALKQVLQNLITNAVKYHDKPDGRIEISAKEYEFPGHVEFSVADNGPGITPKFHNTILKLFQTLQLKGAVQGTGMGLAIVKKIVEKYGGSIRLESEEGQGSSFHFTWLNA